MPSLKSSSKSTDEITLFATERRQLQGAMATVNWLWQHTDDEELQVTCEGARDNLENLLTRFSGNEKYVKDKTNSNGSARSAAAPAAE